MGAVPIARVRVRAFGLCRTLQQLDDLRAHVCMVSGSPLRRLAYLRGIRNARAVVVAEFRLLRIRYGVTQAELLFEYRLALRFGRGYLTHHALSGGL